MFKILNAGNVDEDLSDNEAAFQRCLDICDQFDKSSKGSRLDRPQSGRMTEHRRNYPSRITGIAKIEAGNLEITTKELDLAKFKVENMDSQRSEKPEE